MTGRLLEEIRRWLRPTPTAADQTAASPIGDQKAPIAFVIDDDESICKFVSKVIATLGLETAVFTSADAAVAALGDRSPKIIFLDIALKKSDAVDVIRSLGAMRYGGIVQLMSGSDLALLDDVRRIGERHGVHMYPPVTKPCRAETIRKIIQTANLTHQPGGKISLDDALSAGWLELWYQPKIDLRAMVLAGAEGLIRCRHPAHGVLTPGGWLPGAGTGGLATLTEYVVTAALRDWDEFAAAGTCLHAAVNTSVGALASLNLASLIRDNRPKSDKWPGLILEVTEGDAVKDVPLMHEIATQLKIYGITLAIDDFGEGYSSFSRLREMPFAELKLDMSFVKNCANDKRSAAICKAVIDLAHNFGALAVAEGIDNASDLQAIHRMSCDIGQGYFFARPMPKAEFVSLLQQRANQKMAS
jgi:EAL domain-containing protein (putative c-di-GMP-specific phosphodiesterase class I)